MDQISLGVFVPHLQTEWPLGDLVLRSRQGDPAALADAVRREVAGAALGIEATSFATLDEIVSRSLAGPRFQALLLALFALLALVLGAVGLYAVASYLQLVRRQEMGVRLALGDSPGDLFRRAIGEAVALAVGGVVLGLGIAWLVLRSLSGLFGDLLYGIDANDALSVAVASCVFLGAALLAGLPPALRALRIDPIVALRGD
jgi:ABC-type antimicrobial peptide transport system permease subunit